MNKVNAISMKEARVKAASFCAYQERTQDEVRRKLFEYGLDRDSVEETIAYLITEGYVSEERFAKAYAGGKFRMKRWGRMKIKNALQNKGLSNYCVEVGLAEIDDEDYMATLEELMTKKLASFDESESKGLIKDKVARYLISKGFESFLVWDILNKRL